MRPHLFTAPSSVAQVPRWACSAPIFPLWATCSTIKTGITAVDDRSMSLSLTTDHHRVTLFRRRAAQTPPNHCPQGTFAMSSLFHGHGGLKRPDAASSVSCVNHPASLHPAVQPRTSGTGRSRRTPREPQCPAPAWGKEPPRGCGCASVPIEESLDRRWWVSASRQAHCRGRSVAIAEAPPQPPARSRKATICQCAGATAVCDIILQLRS